MMSENEQFNVEIEQKQKLLQLHRRNLRYREYQAAQYGLNVPLDVHNSLIAEKEAIAILERELVALGVSPQPQPEWQALVIDPDSHWRDIVTKYINILDGKTVEEERIPRKTARSIKDSAIAIVGVPYYAPEKVSVNRWVKAVVKLGQKRPIILLVCGDSKDTAIALRQNINGRDDVRATTILKESFDPSYFVRVIQKILIQ